VTKDYWKPTDKGWIATGSHVLAQKVIFDKKVVFEKVPAGEKF